MLLKEPILKTLKEELELIVLRLFQTFYVFEQITLKL